MSQRWSVIFCATGAWGGKLIERVRLNHFYALWPRDESYVFLNRGITYETSDSCFRDLLDKVFHIHSWKKFFEKKLKLQVSFESPIVIITLGLFRNFDLTETISYLSNQNKFASNHISLVMVFCNLWFELWLSDQRWRLFLFQLLHWSFRSKLWEVFRCCRRPRRTPQNHLRKPMLAPRG